MGYKVTNPLLFTKDEANAVLDSMRYHIREYGCVTVAQMYNMVLMLDKYRGPNDFEYGWLDLRMANISFNNCEGAYEINLPTAVPLTFV